MPKPFHGEAMQLIEAGEYEAVITKVICLGHQAWKDKEVTKFWVEFEIPSLGNITKPLSNFGINTWLSPSKPPFCGFYELIHAVLNQEKMEKDDLEAYDVFELAGKSIVVVIEQNDKGYMNITSVKPYTGGTASIQPTTEIVTIGVEDFKNPELVDKAGEKARQLIWQSREFMESPIDYEQSKKDEVVTYAKEVLGGVNISDTKERSLSDIPF